MDYACTCRFVTLKKICKDLRINAHYFNCFFLNHNSFDYLNFGTKYFELMNY